MADSKFKIQRSKLNWPVVIAVAMLCGASLALFFIQRERQAPVEQPLADTVADEEPFDELGYYGQVADEFLATMPEDKRVIATLIDSVNHHILYFEGTDRPSCYSYDLESLTTSVLFGGENGFYCDTKLLIIGVIKDWLVVDDVVYFIAENRAPEADEISKVLVFSMNVYTHQLKYIDGGYGAAFRNGESIVVGKATLLYHSLFTGEDIYDKTVVQYNFQ